MTSALLRHVTSALLRHVTPDGQGRKNRHVAQDAAAEEPGPRGGRAADAERCGGGQGGLLIQLIILLRLVDFSCPF